MLIKTTYKDSIKVKRIRKNVSKWNLYLYLLIQKLLIFGEKMLISAKLRSVSRDLYIFWIFFIARIKWGLSEG